MEIQKTDIAGVFIIKPAIKRDHRGTFYESFHQEKFAQMTGIERPFVQDNHSFSHKGVLRGLHLQTGASAQAKLIRAVVGEVQDVIVDLRKGSPTFGKYFSIILTAQNALQLYIPRYFAHGFLTLTNEAEIVYKCDAFYSAQAEVGLCFDDLQVNIAWRLSKGEIILSEKDKKLPNLRALESQLL